MKYRIADLLTDEEKARALAHAYEYGMDGAGYCPLGRALEGRRVEMMNGQTYTLAKLPGPHSLAMILADRGADIEEARRAALAFMNDNDEGKILDLAEALGVRG
jgi:hypothetical protein